MATTSPSSPEDPSPGPGTADVAPTGKPPLTGWRAKLPRVPDPMRVEMGIAPKTAFLGWLALALAIVVVGVGANWYLTDGAWVLPDQEVADGENPLGETEVQFLTTHPYDILTATLFIGSTLLLGFSLLPQAGNARYVIRATGWTLFALHWSATAMNFFHIEEGDWVNASFAIASVFVLTYFAYQDMVSRKLGVDNVSLRFAAGAVFIAATVWYVFLRVEVLSEWIIELVAGHTLTVLQWFGQGVEIGPDGRTGFVSAITYTVQPGPPRVVIIILACTAIQSMMIFVAASVAVADADWHRRGLVMAVTIPVVYFLNLMRNVIIIFLWETRYLENKFGISGETAFSIAHNWIGKVGSLIALVIISLFMFRVLPEVVSAVIGLLDLPRRRGPLERYWLHLRGARDDTAPLADAA